MEISTSHGGATADVFKLLNTPAPKRVEFVEGKPGTVFIGRVKDPEIFEIERLSKEEAEGLAKPAPAGTGWVHPTANLKARHHEIARLMAAGIKDKEIAEGLGCSTNHLLTLRKSPAFINLLFGYMHARDAQAMDFMQRIKAAGGAALEELMDRLLTQPQEISNDVLRQIAFGLLDRAGYSPVQKTANVTLGLTPQDIQDLKNANRAPTITIRAKALDAEQKAAEQPDAGGADPEPLQTPGGETSQLAEAEGPGI